MITITCVECNHPFQLSESKIPASTFRVKCPACQKVFQASIPLAQPPEPLVQTKEEPDVSSFHALMDKLKSEVDGLVKAQLDTVRADILLSLASLIGRQPENPQTNSDTYTDLRALICHSDPAVAQQLSSVLQRLKYSVQICGSCSEALARLESGIFQAITTDLAFPDDAEGGTKILGKINSRKMDERRKMFVAIVSDQVKTTGPQSAFFQGANIVVNRSQIESFEFLMQDGLRYYGELYSSYLQTLQRSAEHL